MGVARGQRARLIGPLPSAFWGVVLLEEGSLPWWHAVPEIDQTLQESNNARNQENQEKMLSLSFELRMRLRKGS